MKMAATITINEKLAIPIKDASIDEQGDLRLTVDKATRTKLSTLTGFSVHTIVIVMEDFDCSLVLERERAGTNGSMSGYEDNCTVFQMTNITEANRMRCAVVSA